MRLFVTSADDTGRSFMESVTDIAAEGTVSLYDAADWPPTALLPGTAALYDNSPAAGALAWRVATFAPDHYVPPHFTTSIDLDQVVSGSVVLGLDDGEYLLSPGDFVVMRGVGHSWRAGPDGVTMAVTRIGTAR